MSFFFTGKKRFLRRYLLAKIKYLATHHGIGISMYDDGKVKKINLKNGR
jgi:hypothetical protein